MIRLYTKQTIGVLSHLTSGYQYWRTRFYIPKCVLLTVRMISNNKLEWIKWLFSISRQCALRGDWVKYYKRIDRSSEHWTLVKWKKWIYLKTMSFIQISFVYSRNDAMHWEDLFIKHYFGELLLDFCKKKIYVPVDAIRVDFPSILFKVSSFQISCFVFNNCSKKTIFPRTLRGNR